VYYKTLILNSPKIILVIWIGKNVKRLQKTKGLSHAKSLLELTNKVISISIEYQPSILDDLNDDEIKFKITGLKDDTIIDSKNKLNENNFEKLNENEIKLNENEIKLNENEIKENTLNENKLNENEPNVEKENSKLNEKNEEELNDENNQNEENLKENEKINFGGRISDLLYDGKKNNKKR
jgi:hypothetical protein